MSCAGMCSSTRAPSTRSSTCADMAAGRRRGAFSWVWERRQRLFALLPRGRALLNPRTKHKVIGLR